jgi:hypothetical protein
MVKVCIKNQKNCHSEQSEESRVFAGANSGSFTSFRMTQFHLSFNV